MDWLFISQVAVFGLYCTFLYYTYKSGVGELKKGETLDNIFRTRFFQVGMILGVLLGTFGGLVILFYFFVFNHIDDMDLGVDREWNILVYFIFVASFIYLTFGNIKRYKDKIIRNCSYDIKEHQNCTINSIISNAKKISKNEVILMKDLEEIIEEEQKIINNNNRKYRSPFRDWVLDDYMNR